MPYSFRTKRMGRRVPLKLALSLNRRHSKYKFRSGRRRRSFRRRGRRYGRKRSFKRRRFARRRRGFKRRFRRRFRRGRRFRRMVRGRYRKTRRSNRHGIKLKYHYAEVTSHSFKSTVGKRTHFDHRLCSDPYFIQEIVNRAYINYLRDKKDSMHEANMVQPYYANNNQQTAANASAWIRPPPDNFNPDQFYVGFQETSTYTVYNTANTPCYLDVTIHTMKHTLNYADDLILTQYPDHMVVAASTSGANNVAVYNNPLVSNENMACDLFISLGVTANSNQAGTLGWHLPSFPTGRNADLATPQSTDEALLLPRQLGAYYHFYPERPGFMNTMFGSSDHVIAAVGAGIPNVPLNVLTAFKNPGTNRWLLNSIKNAVANNSNDPYASLTPDPGSLFTSLDNTTAPQNTFSAIADPDLAVATASWSTYQLGFSPLQADAGADGPPATSRLATGPQDWSLHVKYKDKKNPILRKISHMKVKRVVIPPGQSIKFSYKQRRGKVNPLYHRFMYESPMNSNQTVDADYVYKYSAHSIPATSQYFRPWQLGKGSPLGVRTKIITFSPMGGMGISTTATTDPYIQQAASHCVMREEYKVRYGWSYKHKPRSHAHGKYQFVNYLGDPAAAGFSEANMSTMNPSSAPSKAATDQGINKPA